MRLATRTASEYAALFLLAAASTACSDDPGPEPVGPGGDGTRVVFSVSSLALKQGQSSRVEARVVDANGNTVVGAPISFSVAAADGQTVTVSPDGLVTGLGPGAGKVVATTPSNDPNKPNRDTLGVDVFGHPQGLLIRSTPLGERPFGVDVSRDGIVYVTRLDAAQMAKTDVDGQTITGSVGVGPVPTGVAFDAAGTTAYVTNQYGPSLGVVDVASGSQVATIPLHSDPFVVTVAPDGLHAYVSGNTTWVWVVDTRTRAVVDSVRVGDASNGFALHPDGHRLYASNVYGDVAEIDMATNAVLRTFSPNGTPQGMIVAPDGSELYVANEAGWLDVYDLASGTNVSRIPLAGGGFGIALSPDQLHVYVSLSNAGKVQVVNTASRKVILTVDTGGAPRRIAFDYHGGIAVVANEGGAVNFVR